MMMYIVAKQEDIIKELKRQILFLTLNKNQIPQQAKANNIVSNKSAPVGKVFRIWLIKAFSIGGLIQMKMKQAMKNFLKLINISRKSN